jgi:hypothetical protein
VSKSDQAHPVPMTLPLTGLDVHVHLIFLLGPVIEGFFELLCLSVYPSNADVTIFPS